MVGVERFAVQSPYSTPGSKADRLAALPDDLLSLCAAARNVIGHYRAEMQDLPEDRRDEIESRWLEVILTLDHQRHPAPLLEARPRAERVAGCCRDHSLMLVGSLRQRGVPARNRVGFAHYFNPRWAGDHVIVERFHEGRWQRVDPELERRSVFDVHDIPMGLGAPFETAAEAWLGWRSGDRSLTNYGVESDPELLSGPGFVRTYVLFEVAHRYGDETLLWDGWPGTEVASEQLVDELAELLVRADGGDAAAEQDLWDRYNEEAGLRPVGEVTTYSPYGLEPRTTDLTGLHHGPTPQQNL